MKTYEIGVTIIDKDYIDHLILGLSRQGYAPYVNTDDGRVTVYYTCYDEAREVRE